MPSTGLTINGRACTLQLEPQTLLLQVLRDHLQLTGTHMGCDTAQCGACTVLVNGQAVKSCNVLAVQVQGAAVTTIEGLAPAEGPLHPLQEAFSACHGLQCGFCTPGMIMSAAGLLASKPQPSDDDIVHALEGNLCRCTGYVNIVKAVRQAADSMATKESRA
jgi:aerobic carbon-monoxide dehydrogenase small subunit